METRSFSPNPVLLPMGVRLPVRSLCLVFASAVCLLLPITARGQRVPESSGETLAGVGIRLPKIFEQRPAVVVVAFTRKASSDARLWTKALCADDELRVTQGVYGLFMVERVPRPLRGFVVRSISKEVPAVIRSHYIALEEHEQLWRDLLHVTSQDDVCILVIDAHGLLLWQTHGQYSDSGLIAAKDAFHRANRDRLQALNAPSISGLIPTPITPAHLSVEESEARLPRKPTH